MCSKGTGSPPVPGSTSTAFQSATAPSAFMQPMYQNYINTALGLSQTPFNPAMLGTAAPLNAQQTQAGNQLFTLGMNAGNLDPAKLQSIMSPYTQDVTQATQNWFNNQNAIQGTNLLSQAIRSGNAFGGDRAGIAEAQLAGQQQLAQAPVIAGLQQAGYNTALNEYNTLNQMGLAGAQAALGWGNQEQAQAQREADVAQQNAMMQSAYPFQLQNWYGSTLGGLGPLLGSFAQGYTTPPAPNALNQGLGIASSLIGLGTTLFGKRGGVVGRGLVGRGRRHGYKGLVRIPPHLQGGGSADSTELTDPQLNINLGPRSNINYGDIGTSSARDPYGTLTFGARPISNAPNITGAVRVPLRVPSAPIQPQQQSQDTSQQTTPSTASTIGSLATSLAPLAAFALLQRGGAVHRYQDGGNDDDDEQQTPSWGLPGSWTGGGGTQVASYSPPPVVSGGYGADPSFIYRGTGVGPRGPEGPDITGPPRGSPGGLPIQARDAPNLMLTRERSQRALEDNPRLAAAFSRNATAEVGTQPEARARYQASVMDRAASRDQSLGYAMTDPNYYPPSTRAATGVNPDLFVGANPANYATGNASGTVRFAGGPQTAAYGGERYGVEGPDRAYARAVGYAGPGGAGSVGGVPVADGRGGYTTTQIPGVGQPAKTFAQRWAENPFTQLGAALLANRSPYFGVGMGTALASTAAAQVAQRKQDLLDTKPTMDTSTGTIKFVHPDGTITDTHLATNAANVAEETKRHHLATEKGGVDKPIVWHGDYGNEQAFQKPDGTIVDTENKILHSPYGAPVGTLYGVPPTPAPGGAAPQIQVPSPGTPTPATPPEAPARPPATTPTTPPATAPATPGTTPPAPPLTSQRETPTTTGQRDISQPLDEDQKQTVQLVDARIAQGDRIKAPFPPEASKLLKQFPGTTPEQVDYDAMRLAEGDTSVLQQRGTGKAASAFKGLLRARANQYNIEHNLTPEQSNSKIAGFGAQKAGARSLATREANMTGAIAAAEGAIPRLLEISDQIPRSQLPKFNDLILAAKKQTGDPKVVRYGTALLTLGNAYARFQSPTGVITDEARKHAFNILELGYTNGQVQAVADQMMLEMGSELTAVKTASRRYLGQQSEQPYKPGDILKGRQQEPTAPPSARRTAPAPAAPVQVQSIEEARKLTPGTRFIIPEGPSKGQIGTVPGG